jgi:hypothetical protein
MNGNFDIYVPHRNWMYEGKEISLSWAQIQAKLATGDTTFMKTGDYKTITLTGGETVVMEFAGWTYTNGYCSNNKNCADFISRDCLATTYRMNATNTQEGGFAATELLTKLKKNGEIYNKLPSDLKPYIGLKRVFGLQYVQSDNNKYNSAHHTWCEFDGLWLPTEIEVFGHRSCSCVCYDTSKQYDIFKHEKHIIKGLGNGGSAFVWWESSPAFAFGTAFCCVSGTGDADTVGTGDARGVPLCFRLSAA